jgi:urease accessory protein UreF
MIVSDTFIAGIADIDAGTVAIHVEWSRARARKVRWSEEVMLLREEMRRVLRYLNWQARWWRDRIEARPDASGAVQAGVRAFALKQAAWHENLGGFFRTKWDISVLTAAQQLVAVEDVELDNFFGQ